MRIAIIDENPIFRFGLTNLLKGNFSEVNVVESDQISSINNFHPEPGLDLIIIGTSQLCDFNAYKVVELVAKWPLCRNVIVIEDKLDFENILKLLKTGIGGYLPKNVSNLELLDCITQVLKGRRFISDEVLDLIVGQRLNIKKKKYPKSNVSLTAKQFEIATYLATGMKISEISKKLGRAVSTISTIKIHIFKRLNVDNVISLHNALNSDTRMSQTYSSKK